MKPNIRSIAACIAASACIALPAAQASTGLANGSFEDQLDHWTSEGNVTVRSSLPYRPTDGSRLVAFNAMNTLATARIYQYLDIQEGHTYRLQFNAGNLGYQSHPLKLRVMIGGYIGTTWRRLHLGEVEIPGITGGNTRWVTHSIDFTPLPGQAVLVEFSDASSYSNAVDLVLDHVRLDEMVTPVPALDNGGFESGLDGWDGSGTVVVRNTPPYLATEGSNVAVFNAANTGNGGYLTRDVTTIPGQSYLLTFDVGNLSFNRLPQTLMVRGAPYGYKQFQIYGFIDIPGPSGGATAWVSASYPFTATGIATNIWFADSSSETLATDLVLDNVRVTPVTPAAAGFFNGSFENGFAGWDVNMATGGVSIQSATPYSPTDGTHLAAFSSGNSGNSASLSQTVETVPGRTYDLQLDVGNLSYAARPQCLRTLIDDGGYRLLNSAVWISATSVSGGTHWLRDQTYRFTARGPRTTFTFVDASTTTAGVDLVLDHIRLVPR